MATIAEALQIAIDHHLCDRPREAETLYRRILDVDPEQPDALHLLGVLYAQGGRYGEAAELVAEAIRIRPHLPEYHVHLGNALRMLGRDGDAVTVFRRAAMLRPENFETWDALGAISDGLDAEKAMLRALALDPRQRRLWVAIGNLMADAGRFDDLAALLLRLNRLLEPYGIFWKTPYYVVLSIANRFHRDGDHAGMAALFRGLDPALAHLDPLTVAWIGFLKGSWHTARGEIAEARTIFDVVAERLPLVRCFSPGPLFDERAAVDPIEWNAYGTTMHDVGPAIADGQGPVLVCAADGAYVERFARLFLASAETFARSGSRVHIHVVNPGPNTLGMLATLGAGLRRLLLAVTWEEVGEGMSPTDRMTYYTCARFLRLPALMDRYGAPMVISDIDAVWLADPGAFTDALSAVEPLALVRNPRTLAFLYDAIGGGIVALHPEPIVRRMGDDAARFLLHWVRGRRMEYFLDQVALGCVVDKYETRGAIGGIRGIAIEESVYRLGAGVVYQIQTGKRDPEFGRRVNDLLAGGATPERLRAFVADDQARGRLQG